MSNKNNKPVDPELIRASREHCELRIHEILPTAEENLADGRLKLLARNIVSGIEQSLCLGMLVARIDKDIQSTVSAFGRGVQFLDLFERGLDAAAWSRANGTETVDQPFKLWDFPPAVMLGAICSEWGRVEKLLSLLRAPVVNIPNPKAYDYWDLQAWMLVSCLEDDLPAFIEYKDRFNLIKRDKAQLTYDIYAEQYEAVLQRNADRLRELLDAGGKSFAKRGGIQVGKNIVEGGKEFNGLCLDYRSLVAVRIAQKRGMNITYDSEYLPRELVTYRMSA